MIVGVVVACYLGGLVAMVPTDETVPSELACTGDASIMCV